MFPGVAARPHECLPLGVLHQGFAAAKPVRGVLVGHDMGIGVHLARFADTGDDRLAAVAVVRGAAELIVQLDLIWRPEVAALVPMHFEYHGGSSA